MMYSFPRTFCFPTNTHLQEVATVVTTTCVVILTILVWNKYGSDDSGNKPPVCSRCYRKLNDSDRKCHGVLSFTKTFSSTTGGSSSEE